jgi:hypothetical protein
LKVRRENFSAGRVGAASALICQILKRLEEAAPKETGTDRIERVLAEFAAQKKSDPTTH